MASIISALKNNKIAVALAALVAIISIAPHLWFAISLGEEYRGLYMTQAANELEYLGRVQEIAEGHWKVGSVPFVEYKSHPPFMPPSLLEIIFAIASKIFFISIPTVFIISKGVLPAVLFLLIYSLIRSAGRDSEETRWWALGAAAFAVLGYDLVDYRSVIGFLKGGRGPDEFLIWTRPINPVLGGILVFGFVAAVWRLYSQTVSLWRGRIIGGLLLSCGILSYFFSWGAMLSFLAILTLIAFLQKRWDMVKNSIWIAFIGIIISLPYWYNLWNASGNEGYIDSVMRNGLFITRIPILNKVTLATLAIFLFVTWLDDRKRGFNHFRRREQWWYVALSMIAVGLVVFNQQVITGRTVWPYHFVQYVIVLCVSALAILMSRLEWLPKLVTKFFTVGILLVSITFGIYSQITTYVQNADLYRGRQHYAAALEWLNANAVPECVVLTEEKRYVNGSILAFTRCNVYISNFWTFLLPTERLIHNQLVYMRLKGVTAATLDSYLQENYSNIMVSFLGMQVMGKTINYDDHQVFLNNLEENYRAFLKKDFLLELKRYRIDYILVEQGKSPGAQELIKNQKPIISSLQWELYKI
ncbi:MAG TPA: hypothetical protein VJH70_01040 [Candidatus Paceibacterota bacterium]